jgi:DNA polymerase-3 subunit delta
VPNLTLPALKTQLDSRKLAPIYVFVGEDTKLMDRTVDAVEQTIDPADQPFAVDHLYAGDAGGSPLDIAAAARVLPMLGDRRLVIVLRAERLLKPKRASRAAEDVETDADDQAESDAADLTPLEDYVASPVPFTTLLFVATEMDRSRRFTKRLIEKAQVVTFGGFGDARPYEARAAAKSWLQEELTRAGRPIDKDAVELLVERTGGDITRLRGDVERVLLYTEGRPRVTRADIAETMSSGQTVEDDWGVVNAIGDGNAARALREVAIRLDRGDSVHMLVGQLRWWVSTKLAERQPARVRPALEALLRTDLDLKSSAGDERVLIERLIVELATTY